MRSFRVTKKAWYGPKRWLGWGWAITSWQGLLTLAVFVALQIGITFPFRRGPVWALITAHIAIAVLFLVVIMLTSDAPGGPSRTPRVEKR
jgi:hypothetical protein